MKILAKKLELATDAERKRKENDETVSKILLEVQSQIMQRYNTGAGKYTCSLCDENGVDGAYRECGHCFCKVCMTKWQAELLGKNRQISCPICRASPVSAMALRISID